MFISLLKFIFYHSWKSDKVMYMCFSRNCNASMQWRLLIWLLLILIQYKIKYLWGSWMMSSQCVPKVSFSSETAWISVFSVWTCTRKNRNISLNNPRYATWNFKLVSSVFFFFSSVFTLMYVTFNLI